MTEHTYPAQVPLSDADRVLLVALADGELRGRRLARARARVSELPDGTRLLERQRRVRRALVPEPAIEPRVIALRSSRAWRVAFAGVAGALLLAFAFALAGLPGGGSLTTEAAELAAAPATAPAPRPTGSTLAASVDGVRFPNWGPELGWHQTGTRRDTLEGRATTTVFYEHMGHRIAYTILPGAPVRAPSNARIVRRDGLEIALTREAGRDIAVFQRDGRTCIPGRPRRAPLDAGQARRVDDPTTTPSRVTTRPRLSTSSRGGCVTTASAAVRASTTTRSAGAPGASP